MDEAKGPGARNFLFKTPIDERNRYFLTRNRIISEINFKTDGKTIARQKLGNFAIQFDSDRF